MGERRMGNNGSSHIQRDGRDERTGSLMLALLATLLAGGLTLGGAGTGWTEQIETPPTPFTAALLATFKSGKITGVHGTTVQIDNTDYQLLPDAQIQKPEGHRMEVHDIRKGALARFHLKQGRIDMLEVYLPD